MSDSIEEEGSSAGSDNDPSNKEMTRWAPWWAYLAIILAVNYLRQAVMPAGSIPEWAVVLLVVGISAILFIGITAVYRAIPRR